MITLFVFGMIERQGEVRTMPVQDVKGKTLKSIIRKNVASGATIMSDELQSYNGLSQNYEHHRIEHNRKEYVRGAVHTNNIDGFWSLMKRGINGVYHHASRKHLHRYTDEYAYRYNSRKETDIDRFIEFLAHCSGRLTHKELID